MNINELDPTELTKEEAKGIATEYVNAHRDNLAAFTNIMTYPTTDQVLKLEESLASIYRPVVKVGTKNTEANERLLADVCSLLLDAATGAVSNNHGTLTNIQEALKGVDNEPQTSQSSGDTIGVDANGNGRGRKTKGRTRKTSLDEPQATRLIDASVPSGSSTSETKEVLLGPPQQGVLPDSPINPIVDTLKIGFDLPSGNQPPANGVNPPTPINPPPMAIDPIGVSTDVDCSGNTMWVHTQDGRRYCYDIDNKKIVADSCCPIVKPPDPCVIPPPKPVGTDKPPPECPKPTTPCPDGSDWYWNASQKGWQCTVGGLPPPDPKPTVPTCQDWYDRVNLNIDLTCDMLPDDLKKKLKDCGFNVCEITEVDIGVEEPLIDTAWDSIINVIDPYNGYATVQSPK